LCFDNKKEQQHHKSSVPIFDHEQELKQLWRDHIRKTDSTVLCENCGVQAHEWWKDPEAKVRIHTARIYENNNTNYCPCPGNEAGKIKLDVNAHLPNCPIRKKLQTGRYTKNTRVKPESLLDGYSLGVAL
jgi:hypothetical protein